MSASVVVCVTGAAGQIAYALLPLICSGSIFGTETRIDLRLLDIQPMMGALRGVIMELEDCAYPLLTNVTATDDPMIAFEDCQVAVLVGAMPRKEGMERKELLRANAKIFKVQGEALDRVAHKEVKVLVVGNPANTNAYIVSYYAPSLSKRNFSALTRLDDNRARSAAAGRLGIPMKDLSRTIIWGNHSNTQFPDLSNVRIAGKDAQESAVIQTMGESYYRQDFIKMIQNRGAAVIAARKLSSAMSAAKAIGDHLRDWLNPSVLADESGDWYCMAVYSNNSGYHPIVPDDLFYSLPLRSLAPGQWSVVRGLTPWDLACMDRTGAELIAERDEAIAFLSQGMRIEKPKLIVLCT